jgi:glycosyltransferase involved in cell wall biosynthesis
MHVEGSAIGSMVSDIDETPALLSIHDSGTLRCREMLKCSRSRSEKLYYKWLQIEQPRFERLLFPRYRTVTVVAQPDLEEVQRVVPNANIRLIPNGIDTEYFRPIAVQKRPYSIVFHSHLGYAPNVEAALEFANEILPTVREKVPDAEFHIIGAKPDPKITALASRPGIRISADVPDVRPEVCSGQVYVCPIRHGSGIKNKMLEAMALNIPIVAYPAAIVGLNCTHAKQVMEARSPQEFARYTVELLDNRFRAEELAAAARSFVEENFSWESRASAYESLYAEMLGAARAQLIPVTCAEITEAAHS